MKIPCITASATCFKIFIIIDFVAAIFVALFSLFVMNLTLLDIYKSRSVSKDKENSDFGPLSDPGVIGFGIGMVFIFWIMEIFLSGIGHEGVQNRDYNKCLQWFYINCAILVPCIPLSLACLFKNATNEQELLVSILIFSLLAVYQMCKMSVAITFIEDLKKKKDVVREIPIKAV